MKKIQWLLLSLFSICVVVLSDEGQTLITTNGQFSGCIRHLSHFINRHKAYHLSLDVINASNLKATIGGVEIDNNVLLAATAMTGDDNRVLALYCKGTKIYVKQSVDNGLNWPTLSSIDFPTGDDAVYGIDAVYIPGTILLHVVYSTGHSGVDPEVYFKTYNISTNTWVNEQTITDESNMYGKYPSIALSNGKIHVSFTKAQGEFGETRVRERFNNSSIWDISYDVSALAGSSGTASITVVGDYLNILVNGQSGSEIQVHHLKRHISTGIQTTPIQLSNRSISQQPVKIVKLANGYVVAVFTENFGNRENLSFFTFDGALWVYIGSVAWGPPPDGDIVGWAVCANGNDVGYFRVHRSCGQGFGKLDWYPVTPNNVSVSTSSGIQVQWSSNPELDIQLYEVWRKTGSSYYNLVGSTTATTFVDPDFSLGGHTTLYYKVRAKDYRSNTSEYSSVVSVNNAAPYKRGVEIIQTPTEIALLQNYPNPFNPSTNIEYSIPEQSNVTIKVFDQMGREVVSLVNKDQPSGFYSITFDASKLASGIYFYTINTGKISATKKMILMR